MNKKTQGKIKAHLDMIAIHQAIKSHAQAVKLTYGVRKKNYDEEIGKLISLRAALVNDFENADENIKRSDDKIEELTSAISKLKNGPMSTPRPKKYQETPKQKIMRLTRQLKEAKFDLEKMPEDK